MTDDPVQGLRAAGIDRVALARHATSFVLRSIFEHGYFHADPHPGNFFIEPGGRIGLIDFGMVGEVDAATRSALTSVLVALVTTDAAPLVEGSMRLGISRESTDTDALAADLNELMATDLSKPLGELSLSRVLSSVLAVVSDQTFLNATLEDRASRVRFAENRPHRRWFRPTSSPVGAVPFVAA